MAAARSANKPALKAAERAAQSAIMKSMMLALDSVLSYTRLAAATATAAQLELSGAAFVRRSVRVRVKPVTAIQTGGRNGSEVVR